MTAFPRAAKIDDTQVGSGPRALVPAAHRPPLIGTHPRMLRVQSLIERAAREPLLVLIRGETGTGKELVADALHACSPRAAAPLVKVNCGALTDTLLMSSLFGHERGAFTGAVERARGCFEAAHRGTLFLDEIGEISPRAQVALLRLVQERCFTRIGSVTPVHVDVRIVCATNRNLEEMVECGAFREDLYYRLQTIQIELPSLRDHMEDVPLLCSHLLARIAEERGEAQRPIDEDAVELLMGMRWPGNVRQLENLLRGAWLFADGDRITRRDLEERGARPAGDSPSPAWERVQSERIGLRELQEEIEIECVHRALELSHGNIAHAAEILKMKRPRLSQLVKKHGIKPRRPRVEAG